jgi:DNA modification methylase
MSDPLTLIHGDALSSLRTLESESVQTCVTSPPYWLLRDYGVEPLVWDGVENCDHQWGDTIAVNATNHTDKRRWNHTRNGRDEEQPTEKRVAWLRTIVDQGNVCEACGAWRGNLGLEPMPDLYVQHIMDVFRELKRVLRNDGTLWLNLGDSYAGGRWGGGNAPATGDLKPKDLVGIPWMVAFALRADGWYLRSDIVWSKPNPMPESVTDRPTKSHEYIFLLSKSQRYFYDAAAIAEPVLQSSLIRAEAGVKFGGTNLCPDTRLQSGKQWLPKVEGPNSRINRSRDPAHEREYEGKNRREDDQWSGRRMLKNAKAARDNGAPHDSPFGATRNKRTVWTVATAPLQDAHFATFPPDLIKPCILAGAEAGGVVLDPFAGSGTTGKVAIELGRKAILIEPKAEYVAMIKRRCQTTIGLPLQSATA